MCLGTCQLPSHRLKTRFSHTPHPPCTHTTTVRLQCTQINMSNLLKDRPKIVSSVFFLDYESGEPEINAVQTDGCHSVCLPFVPDSPILYVYRGVRRQFDVFTTIYFKKLKICVEKLMFQRRISTFQCCSYSFYR